MAAPYAVLAAIALVTPVACPDCGPVEVAYNPVRDRPEIRHPFPWCWFRLFPHDGEAVAFAAGVQDEIERYAALASYGEPLPEHTAAT